MKTIKHFILTFILYLNITQIFSKEINIKQLPINSFFNNTQAKLYQNLKKWRKVQTVNQIKELNKIIELLEKIIKDLNDSQIDQNQEIKFKLLSICLSVTKNTKPSDVRKLKKEIIEFNEYIAMYLKFRWDVLSNCEKTLLQNIYMFNYSLNSMFLKNEFLNLNLIDQITDLFINRPVEFVSDNPLSTLTITILVVVVISYFFIHRKTYSKTLNTNSVIPTNDVVDVPVCKQDGANCGWNALFNTVVLLSEKEEEELNKCLNNSELVCKFIDNGKKVVEKIRKINEAKAKKYENIKIPNGISWLSGGEIEKILDDNDVQVFLKEHLNLSGQDLEDVNLFDINPSIHTDDEKVQTEKLQQTILNFKFDKKKRSIGFIIRDGGHWFASKFNKNERNSLSACVADSLGGDRRDNSNVNKIFDWYDGKL